MDKGQLYDEYAKTYTEHAKFGLADLAYLELTGQRGPPRGVSLAPPLTP
jgi:flagellar protein FlgJ